MSDGANWIRGQKCPVCDGNRGKVVAKVVVRKLDRAGKPSYTYNRFTHRSFTAKGLKRLYCYQRVKE